MTTTTDERDAFVDGLRQFAGFLDSHPDVETPRDEKFLLALHTIDAVVSFAARFDHVYGYADFEDFCNRLYESRARDWAAKHNMALIPAAEASAGGAR